MTTELTPKNASLEARLELIEKKMDENEVVAEKIVSQFLGPKISSTNTGEVDLLELWDAIWGGKWVIVVMVFVFALGSVFYALSLPNVYRSEALLVPVEESSGGGLASLAGQFGGLASLAGVSIGQGGDKTAYSIEVLKSRDFISHYIRKHDLLVPLMAGIGWDSGNNTIKLDSEIYDEGAQRWIKPPGLGSREAPSMQEAYKEFRKLLGVSQDKKTNFVSVSVEYYSPYIAKQWVDWLVEDINMELKLRDVEEAERSIQFLSSQLDKTIVADMRTIFYELIEEQTKTVMFAEVRKEYAFKTIDEAISPESKIAPKRAIICVLGVLFGGMVAVLYVLVRYFRRAIQSRV